MIETERLIRLYCLVVTGAAKADCVEGDEESAAWDQLEIEVAEIRAQGLTPDVPSA